MEIGVNFPQDGFNLDNVAIRDYAQAAEALGFSHITGWDHVVWSPRDQLTGLTTHQGLPHFDPFVLFAYMATVTAKLTFVTTIVLLPQRQTVLVAKQAAALDVLSGGRLRLGVGVGWDPIEYAVMNENFHDRGRRMEEQIAVMRALWTQELVDFDGKWHHIHNAGISPMPLQRPIPVWIGGYAESAMRRAARRGEGWFVQTPPDARAGVNPQTGRETIERMRSYLAEAGRDAASFGIHAHSFGAARDATPDDWQRTVEGWRALGVTHLTFNATPSGSPTLEARIATMRLFKETIGF